MRFVLRLTLSANGGLRLKKKEKKLTTILMTQKMLWTSLLFVRKTLLFADSSVYKEQPTTNAQADLHFYCSHMA